MPDRTLSPEGRSAVQSAATRLVWPYVIVATVSVLVGTMLPKLTSPRQVAGEVAIGLLFLTITALLLWRRARTTLSAAVEAEEAGARARHTLEAVLAASPAAIIATDEAELVRIWNPAAAEMFGWTAEEVIGRPRPPMFENVDRPQAASTLQALNAGGGLVGLELYPLRKDGTRATVLLWARGIPGRVPGEGFRVAVLVDIADRVRAKQALREARQAEEMSAAVNRGLAHADDEPGFITAASQAIVVMGGYRDARFSGGTNPPARDAPCHRLELPGIGVLDVFAAEERVFSPEEGDRLSRMAGDITFGIHTLRARTVHRQVEVERDGALEAEKAARAEAEAAGETLARTLDRISDAVVSFDRELRHVYLNATALRPAGQPKEALLGRRITEALPEVAHLQVVPRLERALREQVPSHHILHVEPWGRWFDQWIYPSADGVTCVARDITDQRRAELTTDASEARLRLAAKSANIGLWDWNLDTNEVYFSPEWKSQLGYAPDEISNRFEEWESRLHPEDRLATVATVSAYVADPQGDHEAEFRLRHRDGSYRWIYTRAAIVQGPGARRMLGCHVDVTGPHLVVEDLVNTREELRALAAALETAREQERVRIARELHDELGQALTGLALDLAVLQADAPKGRASDWARPRLAVLSAHVEDTLARVRRIATELRPDVLDHLGLSAAVEWQVREFEARTGIRAVFEPGELDSIGPQVGTAAFRILQEGLTNVLRHAAAGRVDVRLERQGEGLLLEVCDDGRGLGRQRPGALGLVGVRERLAALGGGLEVGPGPVGGTLLRAHFPLSAL